MLSSSASIVQLAEALEKPGKPTFLETPAWSFSMGLVFLGLDYGWQDGGFDFSATVQNR